MEFQTRLALAQELEAGHRRQKVGHRLRLSPHALAGSLSGALSEGFHLHSMRSAASFVFFASAPGGENVSEEEEPIPRVEQLGPQGTKAPSGGTWERSQLHIVEGRGVMGAVRVPEKVLRVEAMVSLKAQLDIWTVRAGTLLCELRFWGI